MLIGINHIGQALVRRFCEVLEAHLAIIGAVVAGKLKVERAAVAD